MVKNYSLQQLPEIAKEVAELAQHNILLFYGEMGVGKTTLIKEILKLLGVKDNVSSPTFSLVNEYQTNDNKIIYHFDFYRIKNEEEAMDMGIEEYFYSDSLCLIEWPNKVENLLPLKTVSIKITLENNQQRTIAIKNNE
ncbi:MAG: tRNA (adenosine(37)-N6)-threonylcarbamoyltransferase complex ATPase subunit type 1 TsaE [Lutibacter sp.]|uniref:tRNA (adenosine(37)-N6)-threonylcarbamoyltransferase complex ATPase subunit type 1 TsaE n=1 Tax=Lutibacter sp. TaxID=1925666 RepID=UPI00178E1EBF|nr:tRNA (adenosine(37)-N6)-threonylcarbamoyltransferase complex ATPase subunit type 1 TsaE [Lutibacter sp.]MBT8317219.1 tRNA (adenosine(37)-N6)-threonylcarbamoyltransferase complex ATPase subunit type 1 TsaE [Lutibacter sp.]NNJ58078.1 tRNA (adenosine(37)-N6)-threonylcarbamoyltransferase complex ATPase subunit type 1 TsaE [Lutibacter sp.]